MSEVEKASLNLTSALDPRFKSLLFLPDKEKQETLVRLVAEAAATLEHHDDQVNKYKHIIYKQQFSSLCSTIEECVSIRE